MNDMLTIIVWDKELGKSRKEHMTSGGIQLPKFYTTVNSEREIQTIRSIYHQYTYEDYKKCPSWVKNLLDKEYE